MKDNRYSKFKKYFAKKGIKFDNIFKDTRENHKYPYDYNSIIERYIKTKNEITILLSCYDIEINSSCNNEFLKKINNGQLSLNKNLITVLIPHIKLSRITTPNMLNIAKAINNITAIMNKEAIEISSQVNLDQPNCDGYKIHKSYGTNNRTTKYTFSNLGLKDHITDKF